MSVVRRVLTEDPTPPRRVSPGLHPDLETIILRCLEKEPLRRYQTAAAVADELDRFLAGDPIVARPLGAVERLGRWARRRPALVVGAVGLILAPLAGGFAWTVAGAGADRASAERDAARAALVGAETERTAAVTALEGVEARLEEEAAARRAAVQLILDEVRDGTTLRARGGADRAVDALVRDAGPETLELLSGALDEASLVFEDATRQLYLEAATPSPAEVVAGGERIDGVADAFDARLRASGDATLHASDLDRLERAERRIVERAVHGGTLTTLVAARQSEVVPAETLELAKVCVLAFDRLGAADHRVRAALLRYVVIEHDQLRAARAGVVLARSVGSDAAATLRAIGWGRFGGRTGKFGLVLGNLPEPDVPSAPPSAASGELVEARRLRDAMAYGEAVDAFGRAIDADPGSAEAWAGRGEARLASGDRAGAVADLTRAVEIAPDRAESWCWLGWATLGGDPTRARAALDRAVDLDPGLAFAWKLRGVARLQGRDAEGAMVDLTKAVELTGGEDASILVQRAQVYERIGRIDEALVDYTAAIELDARRELDEGEFYQRGLTLAVAHIRRAAHRRDRGAIDDAAADAIRATELAPQHLPGWELRAELEVARGDRAAALRSLDRAIELSPRKVSLLISRARFRKALRLWQAAADDYGMVIALDPNLFDGWFERGTFRLQHGDPKGAADDLGRAVALRPEHAVAWDSRGRALMNTGELDEAIAAFSRAIDALGEASAAVPFSNRGEAKRRSGDHDGAVADCRRATELEPGAWGAWNHLGTALRDAGKLSEAIAAFDRALGLDPRAAVVHLERGLARRAAGDRAGAVGDLERFVGLAPGDPRVARANEALEALRR